MGANQADFAPKSISIINQLFPHLGPSPNPNLPSSGIYNECEVERTFRIQRVAFVCKFHSPLSLFVRILEGIVSQRCFVPSVLHHIVPRNQALANCGAPWLEALCTIV